MRTIDVYRDNLDKVMDEISDLVEKYPIVGVDTEFPGAFHDHLQIAALAGRVPLTAQVNPYHKFAANVNNLKLIQLGLAFANEHGEQPPFCYQFNLAFDLNNDLNVEKSIELLRQHNIDFERFRTQGINPVYFSYRLCSSGLLANPAVTWVFFHGQYDAGYMVKAVTLHDLPLSLSEFIFLFGKLFPNVVDLKVALKWDSSLQSLMSQYNVERRGDAHQAGSDALGTIQIYLKTVRIIPKDSRNKIYDLEE